MNLDSLSFALTEISYSVANLTKKNFKSSIAEINHLEEIHGAEADRHLFRCLFSHVDFSCDGKSSGKDFHQTQYLIQECASLISKPNFVSTLCYAIDNPLHHQKSLKSSAQLFPQLSKVLKLTRVQEVVFSLALLNSSSSDTKSYAAQFVKQKLPDLLRSYVDSDITLRQEGGLQDIAIEGLHLLLTHLVRGKDKFGIGADQKEAFLKTLRKDFPRDSVSVVLSPLLYPETEDSTVEKLSDISIMPASMVEASLADMVLEAGYACSGSLEECRNTLIQFGAKELTPSSIAKVLGMMAKTPTGLNDQSLQPGVSSGNWNEKDKTDTPGVTTWNIDIFVQVVQELVPHINWSEIVFEMDHTGFVVLSKRGLRLLVQGLKKGLKDSFPVEHIFKQWNNTEGQLSFIVQSLKNPDVFCLADYPFKPVATEILKAAPDEDNRDIVTWKSLDLVEALLRLSEFGHYQQVSELFKFPVQNCPDMLVLALLQITVTWNILKQELLSTLMPIFLGNHPNSAIVLHYAWHCQGHSTNIRTLIMHSMAEWYMRGEPHDQIRLSRILDVAQDLKALSMLLNATPFPFVIDLACLASRREYLKLDKWLNDKIREHREHFVSSCVNFLKRRCPMITGGMMKEESQSQVKSQQLSPETVATILSCLQVYASSPVSSQELSEAIHTMVANANIILSKARQARPGVVGAKMAPPLTSGLANAVNVNIDPLNSLGPLNMSATSTSTGFPQSLATLSSAAAAAGAAPGSPAKGFPGISQASQGFGSIQTLTSQLQNLSLQTPISTAMGAPRNPINSLGSLSAQAALKQQQNVERMRLASAGDMSNIFPEGTQNFTKEVEDEANSYFQKIYNQPPHSTLTIDEVLEMLKTFKDSPIKREQDVCQCMLRNLFEEYCFFPQYPERELHTTAVLFGGIIEQGLVTYMALGIALRYVLEALRKPHGTKMYFFGIAALDRFKSRLKDYPQYCQHLAGIPHFPQFPQHLIDYVEYGANSQEPPPIHAQVSRSTPTVGVPPVTPTSVTSAVKPQPVSVAVTTGTISSVATISKAGSMPKPSIANATNIDTLLAGQQKEEIAVPPESFQDKVFFIFNNLSMANMTQKAAELQEHVAEECVPWVAMYMVMKRASIEPNFHVLYANFVDVLNITNFASMVLKETFRNIKVLLRSDKGVANFSDRTLLKNLGHWLGMLTLAKNKPILQIDIDLKALLFEAYHKGAQELLYVVPFTAKVLESCAKSKVFKPPNPWTMAVMNVLAELHQEQNLKLNLKFEIEVLCKTLNLDIVDMKASNYLKDTNRVGLIDHQLSAPNKQMGMPRQEEVPVAVMTVGLPTLPPSSSTMTTTTTTSLPVPQQPQFRFQDISTMPSTGLVHQITINDQIPLLHAHPNLKQFIRPAIDRAIHELLPPVVDRSIKIALTSCEQVVKKDFALDPDENRMRNAAQNMICSMTAGLTLITCREPLFISLTNSLKTAFVSSLPSLRGASQSQKELIEQAATQIASENTELACAIIQKSAVEKAAPEMDRRLSTEFELRRHARGENRRYCDPVVLTYQAERMPEQIRLRVGGVTPQQVAVYDEFQRNIPGFLPVTEAVVPPSIAKPMASYPTDGMSQVFDKILSEIDQYNQAMGNVPRSSSLMMHMQGVLEAILLARTNRDVQCSITLVQKVVEGLMEHYSAMVADQELMFRFRDCQLLVLKGLSDNRVYGHQWTCKQVTRAVFDCRDDYKYNIDALDCLIRHSFINMQQYDIYLMQLMDNGMNYMAVVFAMQLVQRYCIDEKPNNQFSEVDLFHTIENLAVIATRSRQAPDGLKVLVESLRQSADGGLLDRAPGGPTSMMQSGITQAREYDDPPWLHEKTEYLLREWVNMYHSPAAGRDSTKAFTAFVQQMHHQGILKTDDLITRFFRLCTEMCVDLCYRALGEQSHNPTLIRAKCFHTLDAFVRLIALLVKHSGDATNTVTKINLLNKVLGIVAGVLLQDHEVRHTEFQQMPYHRIFIMLFIELNAPEPILETINFQVLTAFCNTFHILRPARAPGFAYAWLELISHRVFIGRMLALTPQQMGWGKYAQLLIDLFRYLAPFLRNADLTKPTQLLYKGMLRALLVLLHDFPEFLCDYHYAFCDVIPPNCIQMRNLILSAFPRNMRMPDPFTPNLKVDILPDIARPPRILTSFASMIQPESFKKDLDSYLKTRTAVTFLSELRSNLQSGEPGSRYNIPLINALVLYVGTQAIDYIHSSGYKPSMRTIAHTSHMDIFQNLAVDLDTEGRYLFLTAITNQLRYPNSHTHYFSCTLLYLFAEANTEAIQEQITRVLLERLIVNRPHPWGLLITFIELIKNPQFKFWNHEFVHCAPEIEKLFESVARSCIQSKQAQNVRDQDCTDVH